MEQIITNTFAKHYDPTHTTVLRNVFANDMKKRFTELAKVVAVGIVTNDCFGLQPNKIQTHQMTPPLPGGFNFALSADKLDAFMKWLQEQVDKGIIDIRVFQQVGKGVYEAWTNLYLYDSYKRGVIRARYELEKAGVEITSLEKLGGIEASLMSPFHVDRLGLIYIRAFNELKGITDAMASIISRVLAQGLADGDGPVFLARKLVAAINGTGIGDLAIKDALGRSISAMQRAMLLARTEIIRAHHLATIQEYRNWGVLNITVKGEWKTAGDDRVCDRCAQMEGKIFTLDEIEPLIPLHPDCRCIALPYVEELQKYKNN